MTADESPLSSSVTADTAPEWLDRSALFDRAPIGFCLMRRGRPLLINRRFARMLGGSGSESREPPAAVLNHWPGLWPQLTGIGDGHRLVALDLPQGGSFSGRAFSQAMGAVGPDVEIITLVTAEQVEWMSFSSDWRARMLAQAESMCRTGSAELDLDTGRAVVSKGLGTLVGHALPTGPVAAWRLLRWLPQAERGYAASIWGAAIVDEPFEFQHRLQRADGSRLEVLHRGIVEVGPDGRRHGYLILQDITAQREAEQRIQELATQDEVTGLSNRAYLLDRMDAAVQAARWDPRPFTVLSILVDQIDQLAQAMGYGVADALAMAVAARLRHRVGPDDLVARVGSGEFAVLLSPASCESPGAAEAVATALVQHIAQPERLGLIEMAPTARVGVASFPDHGASASQLLEAAQTARMGSQGAASAVAFYTPQINELAMRRLALESGLRHAIERNELALHYQLQVDLMAGQAVGAEVLLRWTSAELGPVTPEEFLPVARQSGLIVMLGDWQREAACRQLRQWLDLGLKPPRLALNHGSLQLQQPDIVAKIQASLVAHALEARYLGMEVTERALSTGLQDVAAKLAVLRTLGVEIVLDDFGTDASNLGLLRSLPIDVLKIHRSCVPDVTAAPGDVSLTRAIINMAHGLQIRVLAEGVETDGQLTLLVANACDRAQGTAFSPVVDAQGMEALLRGGALSLPERFMRSTRERTLLLVDDEPNIVSALKRLFRRDGYRIVTASSGIEGLQRMAEVEVDVVLSDQRMPGMTGVEFLRRAKELYPDTIRMVLSGYTELQSITDAVNEGAIYRFLTKPWDDERLRQHVQEAFRQKGMGDENRRLAREVREAGEELTAVNARLERVLGTQQAQLSLEAARSATVRDMLDQLPVPLFGVDCDGLLVMVNGEAQALMGAETLLLGQPAEQVLPEPLRPLWGAQTSAALQVEFVWRGRQWRGRSKVVQAATPSGRLVVLDEIASHGGH